jgi:hypothetical protein
MPGRSLQIVAVMIAYRLRPPVRLGKPPEVNRSNPGLRTIPNQPDLCYA